MHLIKCTVLIIYLILIITVICCLEYNLNLLFIGFAFIISDLIHNSPLKITWQNIFDYFLINVYCFSYNVNRSSFSSEKFWPSASAAVWFSVQSEFLWCWFYRGWRRLTLHSRYYSIIRISEFQHFMSCWPSIIFQGKDRSQDSELKL